MLFNKVILEKIGAGNVNLAYRRWNKLRIKINSTLRTTVGVLKIDSIEVVELSHITDSDALQAGFQSREALFNKLDQRLEGVIYKIGFHRVGLDPRESLRLQERMDATEYAQLKKKLEALDARSRTNNWVMPILDLIGARGSVTAGEIAQKLEMEKNAVKIKVRKLKELGLTESLPIGYTLSPRGRAFHKRLLNRQ